MPDKPAPKIFVSYSRKDKRWLSDFQTHIEPFNRNGTLEVWDDTRIKPGSDWLAEIKNAIAAADIAVLLVTPNFLASAFIAKDELPPLLTDKRVFWIAVSHCNYTVTEIGQYQAVNDPNQPLKGLTTVKRDAAWVSICQKLVPPLHFKSQTRASHNGSPLPPKELVTAPAILNEIVSDLVNDIVPNGDPVDNVSALSTPSSSPRSLYEHALADIKDTDNLFEWAWTGMPLLKRIEFAHRLISENHSYSLFLAQCSRALTDLQDRDAFIAALSTDPNTVQHLLSSTDIKKVEQDDPIYDGIIWPTLLEAKVTIEQNLKDLQGLVIAPSPGKLFNAEEHEPEKQNTQGRYIEQSVMKGYRYKKNVTFSNKVADVIQAVHAARQAMIDGAYQAGLNAAHQARLDAAHQADWYISVTTCTTKPNLYVDAIKHLYTLSPEEGLDFERELKADLVRLAPLLNPTPSGLSDLIKYKFDFDVYNVFIRCNATIVTWLKNRFNVEMIAPIYGSVFDGATMEISMEINNVMRIDDLTGKVQKTTLVGFKYADKVLFKAKVQLKW